VYLRQNAWNGYAMDEWKVGPNLTLNLGVRYELFVPIEEKYGRLANLAIAPYFTSATVVTPASPGVPAGLINPDYNNFSPRLGLAWKVSKIRRSTVVRLGYGIYYNGQAYTGLARNLAQQPPFAVSESVNSTPTDVLTIATAFQGAAVPGTVTNTYAVDPNYRTPYAQTWSVSIQHDLGAGFFTEIGYLGTKGTRLDVLTAIPSTMPCRRGCSGASGTESRCRRCTRSRSRSTIRPPLAAREIRWPRTGSTWPRSVGSRASTAVTSSQ
jgi:hypothetical protein